MAVPTLGHTGLFSVTLHNSCITVVMSYWLHRDSKGGFFFHAKHLILVILKAAINMQIIIDKLRYAWTRSQSFFSVLKFT